jgi:dienelactone hydrolase
MKLALSILFGALTLTPAAAGDPLPGTEPLAPRDDTAAAMVSGIHRFLDRQTGMTAAQCETDWLAHRSDPAWLTAKRATLRRQLGLTDARGGGPITRGPQCGAIASIPVHAATWPVFRSLSADGLIAGQGTDAVIILPDCGISAEQSFGLVPGLAPDQQDARQLSGLPLRVLVMPLLDRRSAAPMPNGRRTAFSQREVLWRAAFEMGRTVPGYEIQMVLAAADALAAEGVQRISLLGSGEGAWIALLAAAADPRFSHVAADGCLGPSSLQWQWPIDRTIFGFQQQFSTASLAALLAPQPLLISHQRWPDVSLTDANGGAPGRLARPSGEEITATWQQLVRFSAPHDSFARTIPPSRPIAAELAAALGHSAERPLPEPSGNHPDNRGAQQGKLFAALLEDTQQLMRASPQTRAAYWSKADFSGAERFAQSAESYRAAFWDGIVGRLPPATQPPRPRSRFLQKHPSFTSWEIELEVYPDVFAAGTFLVPHDLKEGEPRPVVVCQHGLEGRPSDVADPATDHPAYHAFAARLAEKGYLVFAPQNPYTGGTEFRQLCRKAWPLGLSLWSFIVRQHETILSWLQQQPHADPQRIAFYGLSYGGKAAMRIPALLPGYCLSICSADYNEWIWKTVDAAAPFSYLHTKEYDMAEWNLANTCNYAELSWLIFPRPFMVERGHDDNVSCDEWVAWEYARTRRHYSRLGLASRTEIEFFNGPHTIQGLGTFQFLDRFLRR